MTKTPLSCVYASGALRVSTGTNSETLGPRSHILGWIGAAERRGILVDRHIVGDRYAVPKNLSTERLVRGGVVKTTVADLTRMMSNKIEQARLRERLRTTSYQFVYERHGAFQALGRVAGSAPWVLESNGLFYVEAKKDRRSLALSGLEARAELGAYIDCDLPVAISPALAELIVDATAKRGKAVDPFVMPNGVDVTLFSPALLSGPNTEQPPDSRPFTIGFVGSVIPWQNLSRLIRAAKLVSRLTRIRVEIVGVGSELGTLRRLAADLRSNSLEVVLAGAIDFNKVPARIRNFDVAYAGHLAQAAGTMYHSPLKTYEYLSVGKPLILARWPYSEEISEKVPGVWLFNAMSESDLALAIERAVESRSDADGATKRRAFVLENHSWDARLDGFIAEMKRRGLLP